tara:strand:- start:937 stop:1209 length:273 start_codon:yes stop_codon:yes gene_type:complete
MKNITIAFLLTCFSSFSLAETKNDSEQPKIDDYSQLCLAALKSESEFLNKARDLGITKNERDRLVCNEMSVDKFANAYELVGENTIATVQ